MGDAKLVGSLPVNIYPVDHSVIGSSAYAIKTSAGWVVYIGDIRRGGQMAGITEEFIEKVSNLNPVALITEGTRAGLDDADQSENDLRDRALGIVSDCDAYVIADFGRFNLERIRAFWEIAQLTRRRLVITMEDAYFIEAVHHAWFTGPRVKDIDDIVVFDATNEESPWENQLREDLSEKIVTAIDVKRKPRDYILGFGLSESHNFIDLEPWKGVYFSMSHNSDTNSGEARLDSEQMDRWLLRFDMTKIDLGTGLASAHSSGEDLIDMVRQIDPKYLIPMHTSHPEFFGDKLRDSSIEVKIPNYGERLRLE
jgi:ribonuclease J